MFFVHQAYAHRHICARGCTYVFLGLLMNKAYAHDDLCEDACMWLLVRSLTRRMLFEMMRCMCFLGHSHEGDVVGSTHCIWILYTTRVNLKLLTYLGLCKTSHYNVLTASAINPQAFVAIELQQGHALLSVHMKHTVLEDQSLPLVSYNLTTLVFHAGPSTAGSATGKQHTGCVCFYSCAP